MKIKKKKKKMMAWLSVLIYVFAAFGICNMVAFGSGPFKVFERIRSWSKGISEHFGLLFTCMMCLPANFGWIMSLIDWFLIPAVAFTPFNIVFAGCAGLWWLAMILDCCFTSGVVWLLYVFDEWLEREPANEYLDDEGEKVGDEEIVEISPIIDRKTKKQLLND